MGLHDRDYMQDSRRLRSLTQWTGGRAWVKLVAINVAVFLLWQAVGTSSPTLSANLTASATGVLDEGRVWTLLTSGFSHVGFLHLFWNMFFLYVFASELEAIYSGKDLTWLYLFGAVSAAACQIAINVGWGSADSAMLGASGAVMAVAATTTLFFPRRTFYVLGVLPMPLWLLASGYVFMDLVGMLGQLDGVHSGVAHAGHLGGAAAGILFKVLDLRLFASRGSDPALALRPGLVDRVRRQVGGPAARPIPLDDRLAPPAAGPTGADPAMAIRVDDILRKISREGMTALTDEERAILQEASRHYSGRHPRVAPEEVGGRTE